MSARRGYAFLDYKPQAAVAAAARPVENAPVDIDDLTADGSLWLAVWPPALKSKFRGFPSSENLSDCDRSLVCCELAELNHQSVKLEIIRRNQLCPYPQVIWLLTSQLQENRERIFRDLGNLTWLAVVRCMAAVGTPDDLKSDVRVYETLKRQSTVLRKLIDQKENVINTDRIVRSTENEYSRTTFEMINDEVRRNVGSSRSNRLIVGSAIVADQGKQLQASYVLSSLVPKTAGQMIKAVYRAVLGADFHIVSPLRAFSDAIQIWIDDLPLPAFEGYRYHVILTTAKLSGKPLDRLTQFRLNTD